MTMRRMLTLLILIALTITNGAAIANAMCQHQDGRAHALARASSDHRIAAEAMSEETAATTSSKKGSPSEAAAASLTGHELPSEPALFPPQSSEPASRHARDATKLAGRSVPPLLEPPLA